MRTFEGSDGFILTLKGTLTECFSSYVRYQERLWGGGDFV